MKSTNNQINNSITTPKGSNKLDSLKKEFEQLLPGTLYSVNEKQYSAIQKVHEIGNEIVRDFGNVVGELRTGGSTNVEIAKKIIPDIYKNYPSVAEGAISYALGIILGEDREKITKKILSKLASADINIKRLKLISSKGLDARLEKYGEEEIFKQRSDGGKKIAELQGKAVFSEEEKAYVISLCNNLEYRNKLGQIKRDEIAKMVNEKFWGEKNIRNGTSIADCFRRYSKTIKKEK